MKPSKINSAHIATNPVTSIRSRGRVELTARRILIKAFLYDFLSRAVDILIWERNSGFIIYGEVFRRPMVKKLNDPMSSLVDIRAKFPVSHF